MWERLQKPTFMLSLNTVVAAEKIEILGGDADLTKRVFLY